MPLDIEQEAASASPIRDEHHARQEFEELLAFDWQDSREKFSTRARGLYEWAVAHPELRGWMSERVATVAGTVRPSLSHIRLWPLAFLLGQDAHLIAGASIGGYSTFLYRGSFYAVPTGTPLTAKLIDESPPAQLIAALTLELLQQKLGSPGGPTNAASTAEANIETNGRDVLWVSASEPTMVGSHKEYNIVAYGGCFWGLPQTLGPVDLTRADGRSHPSIVVADTCEALTARIDAGRSVRATDAGGQIVAKASPATTAVTMRPADGKNGVSTRAANPLVPRSEIAEHKFPKVIGPRKLITVVMPYYRKKSTVLRSLEALRDQDYALCTRDDIEIILVDDGTPDEIIHDQLPPDVHYVWQRKIQYGICRAKNTGAKLANGRYLAFVDPDVVVGHGYFDSILRGFAKFGDRIMQTGYVWGYFFDGSPDPRTEFGVWEKPNRLTTRFPLLGGLNMAISRNVFFETPGFDEDLVYGGVEDLLFGFHVGQLPGTAMVFNREMEVNHIPHPPGGAHLNVGRTWEVIKQKWPEFYTYFVENGSR